MSSIDGKPLPSTDSLPRARFAPHREALLHTARSSIRHGLARGEPLQPALEAAPAALLEHGACFVTLQLANELRGCIGSLEAYRPLLQDVAVNAYAAAFRDPRFAPLREVEFEQVELHISVLHPPEPLRFDSEQALLAQLRPGVDGLILEAEQRRGTFLPVVWEALPEPDRFLGELKRKAGLQADYWSEDVRVWRYTTESLQEME